MKPTLYERDYYQWLTKTAELLRNKDFSEVDLSNLVEELESMGRSEKHAIQNNLIVVLQHLLKYKYQPQRRTFLLVEFNCRAPRSPRNSAGR